MDIRVLSDSLDAVEILWEYLTDPLEAIEKLCEYTGMALLCLMGVSAVLQIVVRFVTGELFGLSFTWTGELTRYSLVLMTAIGVPYAMLTDAHISLRPLVEKLPDRWATGMLALTNTFVAGLCFVVAYSSYVVAQRTLSQSLPSIGWLKEGYAHVLLGLAFVVTAVIALQKTYVLIFSDASSGGEDA